MNEAIARVYSCVRIRKLTVRYRNYCTVLTILHQTEIENIIIRQWIVKSVNRIQYSIRDDLAQYENRTRPHIRWRLLSSPHTKTVRELFKNASLKKKKEKKKVKLPTYKRGFMFLHK